jgi:hypothetical protein
LNQFVSELSSTYQVISFCNFCSRVETHYFQSSSIPLELQQQLHLQTKALFCFVIISTYISNIKSKKKESRLNKDVIDTAIKTKTR